MLNDCFAMKNDEFRTLNSTFTIQHLKIALATTQHTTLNILLVFLVIIQSAVHVLNHRFRRVSGSSHGVHLGTAGGFHRHAVPLGEQGLFHLSEIFGRLLVRQGLDLFHLPFLYVNLQRGGSYVALYVLGQRCGVHHRRRSYIAYHSAIAIELVSSNIKNSFFLMSVILFN